MLAPTISPASRAEYDRLASIHYRAGPPATIARVLKATIDSTLVGVLVISFPTPNGAWRPIAWPDLFAQPPSLRLLNANIRTISRVITDPRYRGVGIAASLIRAYLAAPDTPRTESIAAWPGARHLFLSLGMRAVARPPAPALDGVRVALSTQAIRPWRAVDLRVARQLIRLASVREAVTRWANASRATRSALSTPSAYALLLSKAATQLLYTPQAFVTP